MILLVFVNKKSRHNPYILVLRCSDHRAETEATDFLKRYTLRCTVKSKTAQKGLVELNLEVRLRDDDTDFINDLSALPGVQSTALVSYNGDYMD